jgi:hypothetical protein
MVAATGAGAFADVTAAARAMAPAPRRLEPDPAAHDSYGGLRAHRATVATATRGAA